MVLLDLVADNKLLNLFTYFPWDRWVRYLLAQVFSISVICKYCTWDLRILVDEIWLKPRHLNNFWIEEAEVEVVEIERSWHVPYGTLRTNLYVWRGLWFVSCDRRCGVFKRHQSTVVKIYMVHKEHVFSISPSNKLSTDKCKLVSGKYEKRQGPNFDLTPSHFSLFTPHWFCLLVAAP